MKVQDPEILKLINQYNALKELCNKITLKFNELVLKGIIIEYIDTYFINNRSNKIEINQIILKECGITISEFENVFNIDNKIFNGIQYDLNFRRLNEYVDYFRRYIILENEKINNMIEKYCHISTLSIEELEL